MRKLLLLVGLALVPAQAQEQSPICAVTFVYLEKEPAHVKASILDATNCSQAALLQAMHRLLYLMGEKPKPQSES